MNLKNNMKNLTSKVSMLILSIGLFVGSTEILKSMHFGAKAPEASGKEAVDPNRRDTSNNPGEPPVGERSGNYSGSAKPAAPEHTENTGSHAQNKGQTGLSLSDNSATNAPKSSDENKSTDSNSSTKSITQTLADMSTAAKESMMQTLKNFNEDTSITPEYRQKLKDGLNHAISDLQNNDGPLTKEQITDVIAHIINEPVEGTTLHTELMKTMDTLDAATRKTINDKVAVLKAKDISDQQAIKTQLSRKKSGEKNALTDDEFKEFLTKVDPSSKSLRLLTKPK